MGVYLYTFRSKATPMTLTTGETVQVHGFEFGMKYSYSSNRYGVGGLIETGLFNKAEKAFAERKSSYVVTSDKGKIKDGDEVFANCSSSTWVDTGRMPAAPVGYAKRVGRSWTVVATTDWSFSTSVLDAASNLFVETARRSTIEADGRRTEERKWADHATRTFCTYEDAVGHARVKADAKAAKGAADSAAWAAQRLAADAQRLAADAQRAEDAAKAASTAAQQAVEAAAAARVKAEEARRAVR